MAPDSKEQPLDVRKVLEKSASKTTLQELGSVPSILSCWGPALSEDAACRIYLLGQPRLVVNGAITALPYQKTTALLAYLACKGEAVERQQVRDLLWPGSRPDKAAANLRHALHFLRKCVGDVLCTHSDTLWLDPARFWLDTQWLEKSHQTYSSIGPFCEGGQDRRLILAGCEHQDGQVSHAAHHAQQVNTVEVGKTEVQDQDLGRVGGEGAQSVEAVGVAGHRMSFRS